MIEASKSPSERHLIERKRTQRQFQARFLHSNPFHKSVYNYRLTYNTKFFNGALNSHSQQAEKKFKTTSANNCFQSKCFERQKWSSDRTENGKCTNVTNRGSRVGQSTSILHRWFATRRLLTAWHRCGRWYVFVTLGHSCIEAQEINANRVLRWRDSHSAAHKTGCQQSAGTTNYVISAKLVPSFRRHSLKDFEQPKSGFTLLFVKFLLSFRNKDIISYKILQKIFYFIGTLINLVSSSNQGLWECVRRRHFNIYTSIKWTVTLADF